MRGDTVLPASRPIPTVPDKQAKPVAGDASAGLTSAEAQSQLKKFGPNALPQVALHPVQEVLSKFWAPVPWMLEAAVLLQLAMGDYAAAAVILVLLVFNAALGSFQEGRAKATLAALKSRLAINASVFRDGAWQTLVAAQLVPGDVVKLSLGSLVPADVQLLSGNVLLDQSLLTGESNPVEAEGGFQTFAGALVQRGEATAKVTATGLHTKFGRAAELVRSAQAVSGQQVAVLRVVRNLAFFNGAVIALMLLTTWFISLPIAEVLPLVLAALLASIPVALPATFTLASALGAHALLKLGVLPTRLSAVDEAASMDVLCVDKTGTLTANALNVESLHALPGFTESQVLGLALAASSTGGLDPVDAAIRAAAGGKGVDTAAERFNVVAFVPFDPATKLAQATVANANDQHNTHQSVIKGAFEVVIDQARAPTNAAPAKAAAEALANKGFRVLAVASGLPGALQVVGLIALSDPPREDAKALVAQLSGLGVRTVMVTGDAVLTATSVAQAVGLTGAAYPPGPIANNLQPDAFAVYAAVLPEGKYRLVKAFQNGHHTVGMCGDGANDAPALRQAQIGIAVSTATDIAKSAAGMVLTTPGLGGVVAAVKQGRVTFAHIQTYLLNSVIKKVATVLFMMLGLLMTGHAILTPILMVLVMITGDFLTMSLATDKVTPSAVPNAWRIDRLTQVSIVMGSGLLALFVAVLATGFYALQLTTGALQTLAFVVLVFGGQATLFSIREKRHLWASWPGFWIVASALLDMAITSTLALSGLVSTPLPVWLVASTWAAAFVFAFLLDAIKGVLFARIKMT